MLWRSTYETGNEIVDNDHKEIFKMVEKILEDNFKDRPDKIRTSVDFLANYTVRHFGNEERLMDESAYPKTDAHKKQHSDFLQRVGLFIEKIKSDVESVNFSMEINKVIVDWLAEHVMGSDKDLADHYKSWAVAFKKQ